VSIHGSDLSAYQLCPRFHWYRTHTRSTFKPFVVLNQNLSTALIQKLELDEYFRGYQGMDAQESIEALRSYEWLFNARFEAMGLRVNIPGLQRTSEGLTIYFTTLGLNARLEDVNRFHQALWVLNHHHFHVKKIVVMHLDKNYVRQEEFSLDCYKLTSDFIKSNGSIYGDILGVVSSKTHQYETMINNAQTNLMLEQPMPMTLETCPNPVKCEFFASCFSSAELSTDSLYYFNHAKRSFWLKKGLKSVQELNLTEESLSNAQYAQIQAVKNQGIFVDRIGLKAWLSTVQTNPISFIDFEWDTYAQPPYQGMRPFDVIAFQFSLHVLEDQSLNHYEYLSSGDCRKDFVKQLLKLIPKSGSILAFNAFGAETIRIKELANMFPEFEDELLSLVERFDDLATVFNNGTIYHHEMRGSYTLKKIHQAIAPQNSYEQLSIAHGMDAVYHYRSLDHEDDQEEIKKALLAYGKMDTLAMVDVYQWLIQQVQN
jgi:hypothetical protein